ncbi:MAG: glycoside hydrolase family 15 protein [Anaerolineae bacterium]|nr:glycoside hydrolase family 15 protein [Anaerolineae bacterium]
MSTTTLNLHDRSLEVILENQQPGGAYLACPVMPDYQFSWFRDGAYIAYALTLDGAQISAARNGSMAAQWESAYRFFAWGARAIIQREAALERVMAAVSAGQQPDMHDVLNARYLPDGSDGPDDWPEFQLDGPGTWLWSLHEYVRATGFTPLPAEWEHAVRLVSRYLAIMWRTPCYDCWEERGTDIHTSTLAAIWGGLKAAQELVPALDYEAVRDEIKAFVLQNCLTPGGELAKSVGVDMVDANLLTVAVPHGLFEVNDPLMLRTLARIEHDLVAPSGGVHRHAEDVYYGGGAWVLLGLHLGWYYAELGQRAKAREILTWVETQADAAGNLPEQVNTSMFAPDHYDPWVAQRGPIANPLLWTHAEYMILQHKLGE